MILQTLYIENFKQYSRLQLEFKEGLVCISGKNGAGKSTIFDAILLSLFGDTALKKEYLRSSLAGEKESILLKLSFEINQKNITVTRKFVGKDLVPHATLHNDSTNQLITEGSNSVTREIEALIGMDKSAFSRSVFSSQHELGELSNTKGEERRKMIRRMVGYDTLDDIIKKMNEEARDLASQIAGQKQMILSAAQHEEITQKMATADSDLIVKQQQIDQKQKEFEHLKADFDAAKKAFEVQEQIKESNEKLERSTIKINENIQNSKENLSKKQQELHELRLVEAKHQQELNIPNQLELAKIKLQTLAEAEKKHIQLLGKKKEQTDLATRLTRQQQLISEAHTTLLEVPRLQENLSMKRELLAIINKNGSDLAKELEAKNSVKGALEEKIQARQLKISEIQQLGRDANCPTCLQPLMDAYQSTLDTFQGELAAFQQHDLAQIELNLTAISSQKKAIEAQQKHINAEIEALNQTLASLNATATQLVKLKDEEKKLQDELAEINQALNTSSDVFFDESEKKEQEESVKMLEEAHNVFIENRAKVANIQPFERECEELLQAIGNAEQELNKLTLQKQELGFDEQIYKDFKQKIDAISTLKDESQAALFTSKNELEKAKSERKTLQQTLENHAEGVQKIAQQQAEHDTLSELNSLVAGFKNYILKRISPSISKEASQLFQRITKGNYEHILVDENFEFKILDSGKYYPINRFSGGEVDLANLCLRLGVSKAIAELTGKQTTIQFLGFDEIFGSQDEERRESILLALNLLKEQYRQIYIITHIESLKEQFPHILEVQKINQNTETRWLS